MLHFFTRNILYASKIKVKKNIRTFLSNAYRCQDQWNHRQNSAVFKKIDLDDLYHQLDRSFQIGIRISTLDVDLFANGIEGAAYQNELEDILFRLRLNPESSLLKDRTMHAVIRFYINAGKTEDLLSILSNRLNYGIFPDYYASNMLMDAFINDGDATSAAKIAVLQMLQEDFDHPILLPLSLHSCYKYLNSPEIWSPPKKPDVDPDEEETKVRVSFIRNPYFDDHFDIVDTNHLIGKTLSMAGREAQNPLGTSSQLIGFVLHDKFIEADRLLKKITSDGAPIHENAINTAIEYIKKRPKLPADEKEPEATTETKERKEKLAASLENSRKSIEMLPGDLEAISANHVAQAVQAHEAQDIKDINELYKKWEIERENHIQEEVFESNKRKTLDAIAMTKESLHKEEEMVFYFDKEDEWELKVEKKQAAIDALAEEEAKSKKKVTEEQYIPPDVHQKRV